MTVGKERLSIVVACRNEAPHIAAFLDSVLEQDLDGFDWEFIVADGISDDGTREILDRYGALNSRLRVLSNPGRIVSTGLNAAIRAASGSIILRMDAHTRFASDYCRRCVETLRRTGADNAGGPARTVAEGPLAQAIAAAYHSPFSSGGGRFHDPNYSGWVDTVPYGCWRKETLERIGLFDESLVRNQDDELNLRLSRSGGKIWQSADIVSWYSPRATLPALFRQYFQYGFWKTAVIRKHRLPASWRHLVPGGFIVANALLLACAAGLAEGSRDVFLWLWISLAALYGGATMAASLLAARRHGWATRPYLPVTFAVYHFAYGLGFLAGAAGRPGGSLARAPLFTRISR